MSDKKGGRFRRSKRRLSMLILRRFESLKLRNACSETCHNGWNVFPLRDIVQFDQVCCLVQDLSNDLHFPVVYEDG